MADPRRARRAARRWLAFLGLLGMGVVAVLAWFENRLVYHPTPATEHWEGPPHPGFEDVWLTTTDGTPVHGWLLPAADPVAGAVLVSHGNAGNLSHRGGLMTHLHRHLGRSVLCVDYPGYGKSGGRPSEAGCYASADAGYRHLTETRGVPADRVVLFGESLGGGVATDQATRLDHEALVLVFTFTSLPDAAKWHFPALPCRTLMRNRFDNLGKIARCRRPVFVAHGTADEVIPFRQGEGLFAAANEPKRFRRIDGGPHAMPTADGFFREIAAFLGEGR